MAFEFGIHLPKFFARLQNKDWISGGETFQY